MPSYHRSSYWANGLLKCSSLKKQKQIKTHKTKHHVFLSLSLDPVFLQSNSPRHKVNHFTSLFSQTDISGPGFTSRFQLIRLSHGALNEVCFTNRANTPSHPGVRPRAWVPQQSPLTTRAFSYIFCHISLSGFFFFFNHFLLLLGVWGRGTVLKHELTLISQSQVILYFGIF